MFLIYFLFIAAGLYFFKILFFKALENERKKNPAFDPFFRKPALQPVAEPAVKPLAKDAPPDQAGKFEEKYIKLEQMMEEKNRILERLKHDLDVERACRAEFENFKTILQQQIHDLKQHNRALKEDLQGLRQKNLELTKKYIPSGSFWDEGQAVIPASPASDVESTLFLRDVLENSNQKNF
ncbi:MAG: hypothetical protein HQL16_02055 [Candidatus Omnitrophica bacterium]|nr:hypothetical protein [Candidatus Omnitrophota bacterium]